MAAYHLWQKAKKQEMFDVNKVLWKGGLIQYDTGAVCQNTNLSIVPSRMIKRRAEAPVSIETALIV